MGCARLTVTCMSMTQQLISSMKMQVYPTPCTECLACITLISDEAAAFQGGHLVNGLARVLLVGQRGGQKS